jgi:DNA-directed RNA polymerase subunit M/transcription elongation factor TFIIS
MQFCSKCGSRMKLQKKSYVCLKCGNIVRTKDDFTKISQTKHQENESKSIYIIANTRDSPTIRKNCPQCGNQQAFHWFTVIMGEHSGVSQERTIEHYKCTKCMHAWAEAK